MVNATLRLLWNTDVILLHSIYSQEEKNLLNSLFLKYYFAWKTEKNRLEVDTK